MLLFLIVCVCGCNTQGPKHGRPRNRRNCSRCFVGAMLFGVRLGFQITAEQRWEATKASTACPSIRQEGRAVGNTNERQTGESRSVLERTGRRRFATWMKAGSRWRGHTPPTAIKSLAENRRAP